MTKWKNRVLRPNYSSCNLSNPVIRGTTWEFKVEAADGLARAGRLVTPHGCVQTPIFMPVGTLGSVKALGPDDLQAAGAQIVLANTYHLMLRPGSPLVHQLGGLHRFMNWPGPILTDSGGFQAFSLGGPQAALLPEVPMDSKRFKRTRRLQTFKEPARCVKQRGTAPLARIDDDGVTFRSVVDGSMHRMTPESCVQTQLELGADIIMPLDHCLPCGGLPPEAPGNRNISRGERCGKQSHAVAAGAVERTTNWLHRCVRAASGQTRAQLFGIVQGGVDLSLRARHARQLAELNLFGYAVGGLSVGEPKERMWPACEAALRHLPARKPRYLMGVGTPEDLLDGIARGVDMFDCVMPTRNARNGTLFTSSGKLRIKRARYRADAGPLDPTCSCGACRNFCRAYLRHLFVTGELLYYRLASLHNITYYLTLARQARAAILNGTWQTFYRDRKAAGQGDDER
ncbi:MAG: tRNA guanosine(34) transglycosylase Tgt [Myxococcota bacterium]